MLSLLAASLISYSFIIVFLAIRLSPADFWVGMYSEKGVENMQHAFSAVFWTRDFGSLQVQLQLS